MSTEIRPSIIGTRPIRPDGFDKVAGRAVYGADVRLPGMLYGRVKRSPHAQSTASSSCVRIAATRRA